MFIDTEARSSAVDALVLPLFSRRVQIAWQSGSVSSHIFRRRDQLRFALRHLTLDPSVSYGQFANRVLDEEIFSI